MIDLTLFVFIFIGLNFLAGGIIAFYYNHQLLNYLRSNYYRKWKKLTYRTGTVQPKYLHYILSRNKEKDILINRHKKIILFGMKYSLLSALCAIIWMTILVIMAIFQGRLL